MNKIEITDLLKFRFIENLQYSPNGKELAFVLAKANEEKNDYERDVWLLKEEGPVPYTSGGKSRLLGWEDEETLLISRPVEGQEGLHGIYKLSLKGGEAQLWLSLPIAVSRLEKVSEGFYVTSATIDKNDPDAYKDSEEIRKQKQETKKKEADYQVVDEVPYWFNGAGFTNGQRTALFTIETMSEVKISRLTEALFGVDEWIAEEGKIYYVGEEFKEHSGRYNRLFCYDLASKENRLLFGEEGWSLREPFFLDGELYVKASQGKDYGVNETSAVYRVREEGLEYILQPEFGTRNSVGTDTMLGGGRQSVHKKDAWYTVVTREDHSELWKYDKDWQKTVLYDQPGIFSFFDIGEKIAFVSVKAEKLAEIYTMEKDGSSVEQKTSFNEEVLKEKYVALPQRLDYSSGELSLHGWVLLPKDYDETKKYPAVLDIHGGPRTVYGEAFFHEMQVWASAGYFVFFTNIKGSDGRGDAFADIRGDYGYTDYQNLMDFTDAVLKAYPAIDEKRVCETGGSYGGFMTNWIIGHTDRFCCAASQRSIANWVSFSFISDIGTYFGPDQCGAKDIFRDTEALWEHSPLKYADKVKTPTLFIHSDQDYRCPLPEGMQMMQALAIRGVDTRMVIFHGENHELSRSGKPQHRLRRLNEITDWFHKYTKEA
ncbi:MAG: S9 family peptidase [Erysipelotrichaceae bacterium]|nr:S9 family peptidase [Erysipelotrichaceae bacterium]